MTVVAHALPARSVVVATGVHDIDDAVEPAIVRDAVLEVPSVTVTVAPDIEIDETVPLAPQVAFPDT